MGESPAHSTSLARAICCRARAPNEWSIIDWGVNLARERRLAEAEELFRVAVEWDPASVQVQKNLAYALVDLGRQQEAAVCMKNALELCGRDPALVQAAAELGVI